MSKKSKKAWTPEARAAASERMRLLQARRFGKLQADEGAVAVAEPTAPVLSHAVPVMPAVDPFEASRRAKLAQLQRQTLNTGFISERERDEAMARLNERKVEAEQGVPPGRMGSREINLIVKNDGTMVSLNGPCICGLPKRLWHPLCLKEPTHVA